MNNVIVPEDLTAFVYQSHAASLELARVSALAKNKLLLHMVEAVREQREQILEANTLDLEASREMAVPEMVLELLKLTPERLQSAISCLQQLVLLPDPLASNLDQNGFRRIPLGTVAFVFEAFPQLGMIAAGMCLKVGNSLILKGGSEGSHSIAAIAEAIKIALDASDLPKSSIAIAPEGSSLKNLLTQEKYLRLVIPYGRPSFVQQVCKQATVSVLPTVMGNCYLYLAPSGNLDQASKIIKASRSGDPEPVNAIEKVIVHQCWLERGLTEWIESLQKQGLIVRGCENAVSYYRDRNEHLTKEVGLESQWGQAYLDQTIAIKVASNLDEAIAWINQYSSGHADVILTDSLHESNQFALQVNSSSVFINAHSRFTRYNNPSGNSNGTRVALGMSSLKTRGATRYPGTVDLNALTTTKLIVTD